MIIFKNYLCSLFASDSNSSRSKVQKRGRKTDTNDFFRVLSAEASHCFILLFSLFFTFHPRGKFRNAFYATNDLSRAIEGEVPRIRPYFSYSFECQKGRERDRLPLCAEKICIPTCRRTRKWEIYSGVAHLVTETKETKKEKKNRISSTLHNSAARVRSYYIPHELRSCGAGTKEKYVPIEWSHEKAGRGLSSWWIFYFVSRNISTNNVRRDKTFGVNNLTRP